MSAPLDVLLVAEQLRRRVPGGIGRGVRGLLAGLAEMGPSAPSVTLLASRPPSLPDPLEAFGVPIRCSHLNGPLLTRMWDRRVGRIDGGYSIVHATSLAAPPVRSMPLVVTVYDLAFEEFPDATSRRGRRWHASALERALGDADLLVATSHSVARRLEARGAARVEVVGLGADHLPPPDVHGAKRLLDSVGVEGEYILTVSTLEPRKNLARLIEAYRLVRDHLPAPWPLVVVGPSGWGSHGLHGPRPEGVVTLGVVGDGPLAALYSGARAVAYVPLVEGFGLPPLEAMRAGAPVVASTGVPSIEIAPGEEPPCLLVDPLDVRSIADALGEAAVDSNQRRHRIERGLSFAASHTWRSHAVAMSALWESLR